ncbi:MAG: lysine 2,3-aminomutase, partial [Clostridia bacterium]|nr:lysine 2,3-aminomutase [Clostridia bacterium]
MADKREIAVKRAEELKNAISDYLESRDSILTGFARQGEIREQRQKILTILGGSDTDWDDYRWHLRNRITDADLISEIIGLTDQEVEEIKEVGKSWRWAVSPYYASLIKPGDPRDPVRRQCIPSLFELEEGFGTEDPMAEEYTSPAPCITRRYPDRLI